MHKNQNGSNLNFLGVRQVFALKIASPPQFLVFPYPRNVVCSATCKMYQYVSCFWTLMRIHISLEFSRYVISVFHVVNSIH